MNKLIMRLIMWYCDRELKKLKYKNKRFSVFEINGTEEDKNKYLMFTNNPTSKETMQNAFEKIY